MKFYDEESYKASQEPTPVKIEEEFGCGFCWEKELFFLDAANNMRVCSYCPSCGRKYSEEE